MKITPGDILAKVDNPEDLKNLSEDELIELCEQLRQFIIDAVSLNPGHFGASLGVVELTVAIHKVFNTPYDKLVWDVGHQAYAHKILTGRRDLFHTNRTYKGISGFPKMAESEYDAFGVGHSSTSISAALGMALASKISGDKDRQHIAVIGDGSMTAGMAFEALNHAGVSHSNLIVILNDNGIAIDQNVGALKEYLTDITTSKTYNRIKDDVWNMLGSLSKYIPNARGVIQKFDSALKTALLKQSNFFESLKFRYFGPVDGHDLPRLVKVLSDLKDIPGPKLLHIITTKGKGYKPAEKEQTKYHAPGLFDKVTGEIIISPCSKNAPPKYQTVFGKTLLELAQINDKIVGITPAMPSGCSMNIMMAKIPERTFDVGIAEQHAVTFAAGLAVQGYIPFCNIYSSFSQRAFDQIVHDAALQNLPVVMCLDRAGLVGEDGATHHGAYDISFLRCIPNITIFAPMDEVELRNMMYSAQLKNSGTIVIRYPRGNGVHKDWQKPFEEITFGKGRKIKEGKDIAFISIGHIGNQVIKAIELLKNHNIDAAHFDLRFVKPIDEEMLHHIFKNYTKVITIEDNALQGGAGSAIAEFLIDNQYQSKILRLGLPDYFVEQGKPDELFKECGLDIESIVDKTIKFVN